MHAALMLERIEASCEAAARSGRDIIPDFFERFFEAYPEQRDLFQRPVVTQGQMVNEMTAYILGFAWREAWVEASLADCIGRHNSYGHMSHKFRHALALLIDAIAAAAGPSWRHEYSHAWHCAADGLCHSLGPT